MTFWTLHHALDVWHTIPRMAPHHYRNPSRGAIVRAARAQSSFMSFTRLATLNRFSGPLTLIFFMTAVADIVGDYRDHPNPHYDRIMRGRSKASGSYFTGTHMFGLQEPYYERPDGERIYYSFHPEWID